MKVRNASILRLMMAGLVIAILVVALACASEEPTVAPTSVPPTATSPSMPDGEATATPVEMIDSTTPWIDRYLQSPGYNPEWGQPVKGGTFIFGANRDDTRFNPSSQGCCYTHGCFRGLPWNSLFRIDPWVGTLDTTEGDLVESWEMSDDGLSLTMQLREGVMFFDEASMPEESIVPAEFDGGRILGDEFVCEDAVATYERYVRPPEWETRIVLGKSDVGHLESLSCPDGPRGHALVMHFEQSLAKTMGILAGRAATMLDKEYIAWLHDFGEREDRSFGDTEVPDNFYAMHGTGAFVPVDINLSVHTIYDANPNYFREGLPLIDRYKNVVIKDLGTRFTALATDNIHFYGEGSYGFTSGQAEQALRDFDDTMEVNVQLNHWARAIRMSTTKPPFDNLMVRKAVHMALDREAWKDFRRVRVGDTVLEGTSTAFWVPPGTPWAIPDEKLLTMPGYRQPKDEDIAEANRLLDEVFGPGERPEITCMARSVNPSDTDGCLFVMDQLGKHLNWEVTAAFVEAAVSTERSNAGNFDIYCGSVVSTAIGDPDDYLPWNLVEDLGFLSTTLQIQALKGLHPELMDWMETATLEQSRELDPAKRQQSVWEIQDRAINELMPITTLGWTNIFPSWRRDLKGFKGYDLYSYTKSAMNERMWIVDS